jgi:uncharacterized protein YkwD
MKMTSSVATQMSSGSSGAGGFSMVDTTLQTVVPKATYAEGSQNLAAFNFVNERRGACGFGLLKQDSRLDAAASAHAKYIGVPVEAALSHTESKAVSAEFFTGANPSDRALAQGYPAALPYIEEDFGAGFLAETNFAEVLAGDLMNAPLHLLSMLRSNRDIGIGIHSTNRGANSLAFRTVVVNMSTIVGPQQPAGVQTFPCQGSAVPGAFYGGEVPDPFPGRNYALNPMGSPIAILAKDGSRLQLNTYLVRKTGDQRELAVNLLTSSNRSGYVRENEIVLVPDQSLPAGSIFEVKLTGKLDGVAWSKEFSFSTLK